jgi:hypothetical protein
MCTGRICRSWRTRRRRVPDGGHVAGPLRDLLIPLRPNELAPVCVQRGRRSGMAAKRREQMRSPRIGEAEIRDALEPVESKVMNINLTPEQEKIVNDGLKSGHFRTVEEVIGEALQVLREKEQASSYGTPDGAYGEAVRKLLAFVEKSRVRLEDVSVGELIHEGHRL